MGKVLFILGGSASGKSTICNKLVEETSFKPIISHTSRPIREGEEEGVSYYYINKKEFLKEILKGNMIEFSIYNNWFYGIHKNSINSDFDYIMVIEPKGYRKLKKKCPNNMSIYIDVNDKKKLLRSLEREENPDCKEICRRFISDKQLFKGIEEEVDYVIENNGDLDDTIKNIKKLISERWN